MKSPKDHKIIQIDITNACQHSCSNCTRFCGHHKKNFFMDFETFKRAVDSLKGYEGAIGVIGGEPTLHPEFAKMIKYLGEQVKKSEDETEFIYPQKEFVRAIHNQELRYNIALATGERRTVPGTGLWSTMNESFKKNYELIQDTFQMQILNDHGNPSYHSPILLSRKELGIPDEEWIELRDNCWMQNIWSSTITPKGAFFCEVAGALDMLFDGPGGWPIEEGWWKRTPEEFGDQLQWCEICGLALDTFSRDANEEIDDISPVLYEKLKKIDSPKLRKGKYSIINIENEKIVQTGQEEEIRKEKYLLDYTTRFSRKSVMYPDGFEGIQYSLAEKPLDIAGLKHNMNMLDRLVILTNSDKRKEELQALSLGEKAEIISWEGKREGYAWNKAFGLLSPKKQIIFLSDGVILKTEGVEALKNLVYNPGTMHYVSLNDKPNKYVEGCVGEAALFNLAASSLKKIGQDGILNMDNFSYILEEWDSRKKITFDETMEYEDANNHIAADGKYILYGTGDISTAITNLANGRGAEILYYVNSNQEFWGTEFMGKEIKAPESILEEKEYTGVIIASLDYYLEIRDKLYELGVPVEKIMLPIE